MPTVGDAWLGCWTVYVERGGAYTAEAEQQHALIHSKPLDGGWGVTAASSSCLFGILAGTDSDLKGGLSPLSCSCQSVLSSKQEERLRHLLDG